MTKKTREKVYEKYNGHCAYCGKKIEYKDMQVDHMKSKHQGGTNDINNYNPSCRRCNHYKRSLDIEGFREYMTTLHERIAKGYITKVGIDFGIVELTPFGGVFYFEWLESLKCDNCQREDAPCEDCIRNEEIKNKDNPDLQDWYYSEEEV